MPLAHRTSPGELRLATGESVTVSAHRYRILEKGIRGEMGQRANNVCRAVRIVSAPYEQPERHDGEFVLKTTPDDQLIERNIAIGLRRQHPEIAPDILAQFECDEVERSEDLTVTRLIPGTSLKRIKQNERLYNADTETVLVVSWRIALALMDTHWNRLKRPASSTETSKRQISSTTGTGWGLRMWTF